MTASEGRTHAGWRHGPARSPLASGWLTGKYHRGEAPAAGTRLNEEPDEGMKIWNERWHLERNCQVLDVVRKLAEQRGSSLGQVAIAWVLGRPAVSAVILGARTLDQLNDNLAAADSHSMRTRSGCWTRSARPDTPDYPYGEKGQTQRSRRLGGGRF
ncbi:MAG TPA: aldo/keto reductase [Streptosporangiaceae bacterium]|nr:aldo/keto reductase [Streptosporangiaceae bacterium]